MKKHIKYEQPQISIRKIEMMDVIAGSGPKSFSVGVNHFVQSQTMLSKGSTISFDL